MYSEVTQMMRYSDDPIADFNDWDFRQQEELKRRPRCRMCGEHIQDEYAYHLGNKWICEDCMEGYREEVPDDY